MSSFEITNLKPFAPAGREGVAQFSALLFFAFTGYARIATLGEEVHNPKKTIPKAVIITLVSSIILYAGVARGIGAEQLSGTGSPLGRAAASFDMPGVLLLTGIGCYNSYVGCTVEPVPGHQPDDVCHGQKEGPAGFSGKSATRT